MIKARCRDHVRSKTPVAMVNEVLCKIICRNICVLIQESHELRIEVDFQRGDGSILGKLLELAAGQDLFEGHALALRLATSSFPAKRASI